MVTTDPVKIRLITKIQADLRKQACVISPETIELVVAAYEKRREELPT